MQPTPDIERYLTARDVAAELHISIAYAYEVMKQCTHLTVGRSIRVSRKAFEIWKRRHEEPPVPSQAALLPSRARQNGKVQPHGSANAAPSFSLSRVPLVRRTKPPT